MRLLRMNLPDFHDGGGLRIDFAAQRRDDPALAFVVGPNGSGKSRLLEALGHIFAHLTAGQAPGLRFEIEYEIGGNRVLLAGEEDGQAAAVDAPRLPQIGIRLLVAGADSFRGWRPEDGRREWPSYLDGILPFRVVGISSGPASRLQWALRDSVAGTLSLRLAEGEPSEVSPRGLGPGDELAAEVLRERLLELETQPRCLAIDGRELVLAVLALLSHPRSRTHPDTVRDRILGKGRLGAGSLRSFSFEVPADWQDQLPSEEQRTFRTFLEHAARRVYLVGEESSREDRDQRAVYVLDPALEEGISAQANTPFLWFTRLQTWLKAGALQEPELLFEIEGRAGLVRHRDLSDGEFLYVGRYALLFLLREHEDCLILLDEPETHFNDLWKIDLVYDMELILRGGRSQVVLATHSDLTLTDADRTDVFVFEDLEAAGPMSPSAPSISPLGADRGEITQQVFGADLSSGRRSVELVQDALDRNDPTELEETLKRLGPGFQRYRVRYALERERGDEDAP
jgi:predicted ATPase